MREIKFRGMRVNRNGEWAYGDLRQINGECFVFPQSEGAACDRDKVITDTVGQFTGLLDKNGKEIYEGDVCATEFGEGYFVNMAVTWFERDGYWAIQDIDGDDTMHFVADYFNYIEVIGNIHDNPELLKQND